MKNIRIQEKCWMNTAMVIDDHFKIVEEEISATILRQKLKNHFKEN